MTTPAGDPAWLVTGYANVRTLLADPRLGRSHPEPERAARLTRSAMLGRPAPRSPEAEQAEHARRRRLLNPSFSPRRMAGLRPRVQAIVDDLLDRMAGQAQPADVHEALSLPLPTLVICELLGVPFEDRDDFRAWCDDAGSLADEARSRAGLARLRPYMLELVQRKRREPAEDVISDLVATGGRDALTDPEVATMASGLLIAGQGATVAAIDKGVVLLLSNPAQREALRRDPELAGAAAEEVLRHPSPVPRPPGGELAGLPRYPREDIAVDGVTIPAWDLVVLSVESANLDAGVFPAQDEFDVGREPNPHLGFGYGPHFCLGAPLARIELQAVFSTLLRRFPGLRLAVPVSELRPRQHQLTGGMAGVPVTW